MSKTASHWFWSSRSHRSQFSVAFWMDFLRPFTDFESGVSRSHRFYIEVAVQCRVPFWMDLSQPLTCFEAALVSGSTVRSRFSVEFQLEWTFHSVSLAAIVTGSTLRSRFSVEFHFEWTFYCLSLFWNSVLKAPYIDNLLS